MTDDCYCELGYECLTCARARTARARSIRSIATWGAEAPRPSRTPRTFTNQDVADWAIMLTLALLLLVIGAAYTGVIGR